MARRNPKLLIVEGSDDLYAVVELMKAHIGWPKEKEDAPVRMVAAGGADRILEPGYLAVELRTSGVTLGVVLDADTNVQGRARASGISASRHSRDYRELCLPKA